MNFLQSHKLIGIVMLVAALAVGGYFGYNWWQIRQERMNTTDKPVVTTQAVPQNILPSHFPSNIPIEAGAKILVNLNHTSTDGRYQGTRKFVTAQSIVENSKIYKNFLEANGWKIESSSDTETLKHFSARKGDDLIQIVLVESAVADGNTVEISVQQAQPIPGL